MKINLPLHLFKSLRASGGVFLSTQLKGALSLYGLSSSASKILVFEPPQLSTARIRS